MAILKNTTVTDTGNLQFTAGTTSSRPALTNTIQSYTLPYGVYLNGVSYLNTTTASTALCPSTSTTPFTVEAWVYLSSASTQYAIISCPTPGYNYVLALGSSLGVYDTTFKPWFGYYNGSTWLGVASSGTAIPLNTWTHVAGVFTGSSTLLFQNGVLVGGPSGGPGTWGQTGQSITVRIGCRPDGSPPNTMTGFVSNVRVVIGTAVYTTGFTPSTSPLTAISGTQLLTCQSSTIVDNSSNGFAITNNNGATVIGVSAFGSTYSWTAPTGVTQVESLVVAGGGGGSQGGGGAGGLIYRSNYAVTPGNSYTVTVGQGGAGNISNSGAGAIGSNSTFDTLTAIGGGGGGNINGNNPSKGGSGGGAGGNSGTGCPGAAGTVGQGFPGGATLAVNNQPSGGGGGAGGPGTSMTNIAFAGGGGVGLAFNISGTTTYYAGGGGGGSWTSSLTPGAGGIGGGGSGGIDGGYGISGTPNTGGGGGGNGNASSGNINAGAGGSGTVIIKYSVVSDNTTPIGITRYNSDIRGLEVYEGTAKGWVTQDPTRNFGGHNLLAYSTITSANWTNLGHTITPNATTGPDGTNTATQLTITASGANYVLQFASIYTVNTLYTGSVYIKNISSTGIKLTIYEDTTGTLTSLDVTSQVNTTGWTRVSISQTTSASGGTAIRFYVSGNSTGNGTSFYVWGAQFEQATAPSPYVATNGAASPVPTSLSGYRYHTYKTTGTSGFTPAVTGLVEVLVVGGGGGGGQDVGGGGGGGGIVYTTTHGVLANQSYTVTVGVGGTAGQYPAGINATNGGNSQFGTLVAVGGGAGGGYTSGRAGGSGGGGSGNGSNQVGGGYVIGQGFPGGTEGGAYASAGGGGAGGYGANGILSVSGGNGGVGIRCDISGVPTYYGGGGGSSTYNVAGTTIGTGGYGGGGAGGGNSGNPATPAGTSGTANTGGGGGGAGVNSNAGAGGSGIVIVRYRYD
jgi:hypothetical protein